MNWVGVLTSGGEFYLLAVGNLPKDAGGIVSLIERTIEEGEADFNWQVLKKDAGITNLPVALLEVD